MSEITKESIKQFAKDKGYLEIIFSPKGREIWDPRPPYGAPVQPFEELPHDNFIKITCYQGGVGWMSGSHKSFIEEIKETNTDFLTELFKWATKKENVKRIDTEQEVADTGNEIAGSIKEVIIIKKTQQDYKNDKQAYAKRADQMIANRKCFYCNGHIKPEAKDCLQHLKNCSLCPEAIKDFAKDKMIELGLNGNDDNSHREREREREREQNRRNRHNLPSRFRRGGCKRCGRTNVLLNLDTNLCFVCFLEQVISEIKEDIKNNGLESTRTAWKEDKSQFERIIQEVKREDPALGKKFEEAFQEIENLLYPDRKKNKGSSVWIWVLVIVGVVVVGIIGLVLWRKKKK